MAFWSISTGPNYQRNGRNMKIGLDLRCRWCQKKLFHQSEAFEKRSVEYQSYLINRGYNPSQVKQQFEKVKCIPRENLLVPNTQQSKNFFPLGYNPSLPGIGKILHSHRNLIDNSPSLAKIFPKRSIIPSYRRAKNIKEILARPRRTNHTEIRGCFKCKGKFDPCKNSLVESYHFSSTRGGCRWCARTPPPRDEAFFFV